VRLKKLTAVIVTGIILLHSSIVFAGLSDEQKKLEQVEQEMKRVESKLKNVKSQKKAVLMKWKKK